MLNLNKHTKTKPKPKGSTHVGLCAYHCAHTQHSTEQFW